MAKRGKLEIIRDILLIIREHKNSIKITPLIRKSNLSSSSFREYYNEMITKCFVIERASGENGKCVFVTEKGFRFLNKYQTIVSFIDEFEL